MLKNIKFVFILMFFIFLVNLVSADVTLEKSRINLNEPLVITIDYNSYSPFVYFYSEIPNNPLLIINLGCPESSCSGRQTFSIPLSSDIFPVGRYFFGIHPSDDNYWYATYFEVGEPATITPETPQQPSSTSCYDGTPVGECSPSRGKPYYCSDSSGSPELITNCQGKDLIAGTSDDCGCPEIYPYCQVDGSCSGSAPVTQTCTDSDGGLDYFVKGTVCVNGNCKDDYCYDNGNNIGEYFCDNGHNSLTGFLCSNGCVDGACLPGIPCFDGTLSMQCSTDKPRYCDNGILMRNYCYGKDLIAGTADDCGCRSGQTCHSDGSCSVPRRTTCSDGTLNNQCSSTKPYLCTDRFTLNPELLESCENCGCPSGEICQTHSCSLPLLCSDETLYGQCSTDKPRYCDNGILMRNYCYGKDLIAGTADDCGCPSGEICQADGICFLIPSISPNTKAASLYSDKEVFLVSDLDWKNVLPFVSATTWTEGNEIKKYPTLIYHEDEKIEKNEINLDGLVPEVHLRSGDTSNEGVLLETCADNIPIKVINIETQEHIVHVGEDIHLKVMIKNCDTIQRNIDNLYVDYSEFRGFIFSYSDYDLGMLNPGETKEIDITLNFFQSTLLGSFDADSIIHFMQQYSPSRATIIGQTPQNLDNLLVADRDFGAGLQQENIQRISPSDYLSYWNSFDTLVYVQDDYELALLASTYASLINAPLIIKGTTNDIAEVFSGRNIICVGNVAPSVSSCIETYNLEQLRDKYKSQTNTDKVILINPDDWTQKTEGDLNPDKSNIIKELFTKTSLASPFLASAKHELILSTTETDYHRIDSVLKSQISEMNAKYLTIMASPIAIPYREYMWTDDTYEIYRALDPTQYADTTGDQYPDIYAGRIMGFSLSDVSSYIARDLFYSDLPTNNNMKFLASSRTPYIDAANSWADSFKNAGYNAVASTSTEEPHSFNSNEWLNQNLIMYQDHGNENWAGIYSDNIPQLDNSLLFISACLTCAYYGDNFNSISFCNRAIRQGAIVYVGAVSISFTDTVVMYPEMINNIYFKGLTIGQAFTESYVILSREYYNYKYMLTLLGDPTFKLDSVKLPGQLIKEGNLCLVDNQCGTSFGGFGDLVCDWFTCKKAYYSDTTCGVGQSQNCLSQATNYCFENKAMTKTKECSNHNCDWKQDNKGTLVEDCPSKPTENPRCNLFGNAVEGTDYGCGFFEKTCVKNVLATEIEKCPKVCRNGACTCAENGQWLPFQTDKCCSGKVNFVGVCSDCQPNGAWVVWAASNCCSGKTGWTGFCEA